MLTCVMFTRIVLVVCCDVTQQHICPTRHIARWTSVSEIELLLMWAIKQLWNIMTLMFSVGGWVVGVGVHHPKLGRTVPSLCPPF